MRQFLWKEPRKLNLYFILRIAAAAAGTAFTLELAELLNCSLQGDEERLLATVGAVLALLLAGQGLEYLTAVQKNRLLRDWNLRLKKTLFSSLLEKRTGEFEERNSAVYSNGLLTDCESLEQLYFSNSLDGVDAIVELVIASVAVIWISPPLFLVMACLTFVTVALMKTGSGGLESGMEQYTASREAYTVFLKENLSCFRLIRMFQMKEKVKAAHAETVGQMEGKKYRQQTLMAGKSCVMSLTGLGSTVLIMAAAAYLALQGAVSAGFVLAVGQLIGKIT